MTLCLASCLRCGPSSRHHNDARRERFNHGTSLHTFKELEKVILSDIAKLHDDVFADAKACIFEDILCNGKYMVRIGWHVDPELSKKSEEVLDFSVRQVQQDITQAMRFAYITRDYGCIVLGIHGLTEDEAHAICSTCDGEPELYRATPPEHVAFSNWDYWREKHKEWEKTKNWDSVMVTRKRMSQYYR